MTAAEIVAKVGALANQTRPEVGIAVDTSGDWTHPNGRIRTLVIVGPDMVDMPLPVADLSLVDLMRVLDVLEKCQLWSPDAYKTGVWILAKWKRLLSFHSDTTTLRNLLQTGGGGVSALELEHTLRVNVFDLQMKAVLNLEMGALRALTRATVEGYETKDGVIFPIWRSVHPTGNPLPLASGPALNSFTKTQRAALIAPRGYRWMQVRYPRLEARVLAALANAPETFDRLAEDLDEALLKQLQIFMRQGATLTPGDVDEWGSEAVSLLGPLHQHLRKVVEQTATSGYVISLLGRRWRLHSLGRPASPMGPLDPHDQRRVTAAYCGHSAATALKMAMVKLQMSAEEQPRRMFTGFRQLLPHFDSLNYLLDERVPHEVHCESLSRMLELQIATASGVWTLQPQLFVGPSWADLTPVDDPQALTKIELARPGPSEVLTCAHCGLTTTSQRVLDTHMQEEHV